MAFLNEVSKNHTTQQEQYGSGFANYETYPKSINEAVNRVFNHRKQDYITLYEDEWASYFKESLQRERITTLESALRAETLPTNWDSYEPAGGIKLSTNLNDIDLFVREKFFCLRQSGLLLRRSEFETKYEAKKFRFPGKNQKDDLTRLWGAEYLRKNLIDTENYIVPHFFIVINNDASTLPITIFKDKTSIVIKSCDSNTAEVVVENVENSRATCSVNTHGWMRKIGYVDYADSGNIREGEDGKFYVVDTEWKSLDGVVSLFDDTLSMLDPSIIQLRRYASERFDAFYTDEWKHTTNLALSDFFI